MTFRCGRFQGTDLSAGVNVYTSLEDKILPMKVHGTRPYIPRSSPQGYLIPDILVNKKGNDSADRTTTAS